MEDNSFHTSVVIELANPKGEPEEKRSYHIDVDDLSAPKDYVIDQIFCGENITIYALFEVPENENKAMDKNLIKVTNSNICNDSRFYYKNSFKITNDRNINGYKQNSSTRSSDDNLKYFPNTNFRKKSLYCLKHPSGNYDLLTPEREKSDLKVLYSKNFSLEKTKSTKFKAISVGVNTDIVQSPRIIEEVQKVLGVNVPVVKFKDKSLETSNSSFMPSYDVTEIETRPSFSSFVSSIDSKNCSGKSFSNLFFVPLLMMEDDKTSKSPGNSTAQKNPEEEKLLDPKEIVSKVSFGMNTDKSEIDSGVELNNKSKQNEPEILPAETPENDEYSDTHQNTEKKFKPNDRDSILEEIKLMQSKLNALFKKIESSEFESESDTKELDLIKPYSKTCSETTENLDNKDTLLDNELESFEKSNENLEDLLPLDSVTSKPSLTQESQEEEIEIPLNVIESVYNSVILEELIPNNHASDERLELKKTISNCRINWQNLGNSRSIVLSKSEVNLSFNKKHKNLRKSLSLDFRNVKPEVFKNIKNFSFKQQGSLKTSVKGRTLPNNEVLSGDNEVLIKGEVGNDANKNINFKMNPSQECKKGEIQIEVKKIDSDTKKIHNEEEGDVKFAESNKSQLTTFPEVVEKKNSVVLIPDSIPSDDLLSPKKSLCSCAKESKPPVKTTEVEKKTGSDLEKPPTPKGNVRKIMTNNSNMKKESKLIKKAFNRYKVTETAIKPEVPVRRVITSCRKPTKNIAESKLHIDKLIKAEALNNVKTPHVFKSFNDEKPIAKGDRSYRPSSKKLETRENPTEAPTGTKIDIENKLLKKKSTMSFQVDTTAKKSWGPKSKAETVSCLENIEESDSRSTSHKQNANSSPSVILRLLSKKPKSMKEYYSDKSRERMNEKNPKEINETQSSGLVKPHRAQKEVDKKVVSMEKSVVKSVWALTKVLLFEDGTKKLEVLEASLTPPKYSLN